MGSAAEMWSVTARQRAVGYEMASGRQHREGLDCDALRPIAK
jgi:hypothetical protein